MNFSNNGVIWIKDTWVIRKREMRANKSWLWDKNERSLTRKQEGSDPCGALVSLSTKDGPFHFYGLSSSIMNSNTNTTQLTQLTNSKVSAFSVSFSFSFHNDYRNWIFYSRLSLHETFFFSLQYRTATSTHADLVKVVIPPSMPKPEPPDTLKAQWPEERRRNTLALLQRRKDDKDWSNFEVSGIIAKDQTVQVSII